MKPVTGFLADNGKFFEDAQECAEYEQFINLRKAVTKMRPQDYGLSGTGNANETLTKFVLDLAESNPHLIAGIAEGSMSQQPEHQPEPEKRMPDLAVMADVIVEATEPEDEPKALPMCVTITVNDGKSPNRQVINLSDMSQQFVLNSQLVQVVKPTGLAITCDRK